MPFFDLLFHDDDHDHEMPNLDPRNLWVIKGKRYDLTKFDFFERHPGVPHGPGQPFWREGGGFGRAGGRGARWLKGICAQAVAWRSTWRGGGIARSCSSRTTPSWTRRT